MTIKKSNISLYVIIGIPVLLMVLSLLSTFIGSGSMSFSKNMNPYIQKIPNVYANALDNAKENDSTFFHSVIEDFAIRELVIFKTFPNTTEVKEDFTIELYPKDNKHIDLGSDFLTLNVIRDAALFNYNGKSYGVFKAPLPIIDVKKLVVKQNKKVPNKESWLAEIDQPFKDLDKKDIISIKSPSAYSQVIQPNAYLPLFIQILKNKNIGVKQSYYSKRNDTLFKTTEDLISFCTSNNKTIGRVKQRRAFWERINSKDKTLETQISFQGTDADKAKQLLADFLADKLLFEDVFNIQKLALFNALRNVFIDNCSKEIHLSYNSKDNLLEPFYMDSNCAWVPQKFVKKSNIENTNYLIAFAKALNEVSNIDFYSNLIKDNISLKHELALINNYDTDIVFNYDVINANQKAIKKSLNPSSALKVELISMDSQKMIASAYNLTNYPIEVIALNHLDKKEITNLNPVTEILSGQKDTIVIDLPRSFENLFVSKKKKIVGFVLPKHIHELSIQFSVVGLNKTIGAPIIPYQKNDKVEDDLFRTTNFINNHESIIIDEEKKEISFSKDSVVISSPLVVDKGYTFKVNPGTIVNIIEGGKIISHSPLNFIGTNNKPIKVYSSDDRGQGLLVLSRHKKSTLKHVVFNNLRNPTHGNWGVTGSVTFYESPVNLEYVSVMNNKCEDALNIVRTNFIMSQVTITNTQSDAFDGDFVKGSILNCKFDNLGNDAIDVSGSDLLIRNVIITNAGDKGLSAGENSKMTINGVEISDSAIAVAGKDLSIVNAKNLKISRTKLGFTAFQKKPEFGPSEIIVNGISMSDIETKYLIESSSSLFVDNKKIETTQNVKDRMYGVEFGRSSAETRNTPQ